MVTPEPRGHAPVSDEPAVVSPRLLYTTKQAAGALGIGRSKLYDLLRDGELESIHIGAARRIPAQALDEFIELRRTAARALGRLA